ncbi:UPF0686 protein C11orf1-like [Octopus sinensis]|uniref:UPF0686 protein C11orf1-like n=1 Tax=Octopus sinensis TaxID=2607531 RepID=A0A7E6FGH5_9MOLL|nr:UPF0686 protein C11orf1-like [Octopus sinensis]
MARDLPVTFPFEYAIRASGQGEPWTRMDFTNEKFNQYGWRCSKYEDYENPKVLMGNWRERSYSDGLVENMTPMRSQFDGYFKTTYQADYGRNPYAIPKLSKGCQGHYTTAYPGHKPVNDFQSRLDNFRTTYRTSYCRPQEDLKNRQSALNITSSGWQPFDQEKHHKICMNRCIWQK